MSSIDKFCVFSWDCSQKNSLLSASNCEDPLGVVSARRKENNSLIYNGYTSKLSIYRTTLDQIFVCIKSSESTRTSVFIAS